MKVKKYERKLCPSGAWDNGLWELSNNTVEFPTSKLKQAIVETVSLKMGTEGRNKCRYFGAFRVTIDGASWNVETDPRR